MHYPGYNGKMKIRLFLSFISVTLAGCQFGGGFTHISPSVGSKTSAPNEEFMYLDLNEAYYDNLGLEPPLYEINTTEEAGDSDRRDSVSNCEILYEEDEPAAPEIICILDYMEEEFLIYDLSFVLNVPKGMCATLRTMPAWHYNRAMGYGPPTIYHQIVPGAGDDDEDKNYYYLGNSASGIPCAEDESEITEKCCPYIYTKGKDEKVNCCLGEYTIVGDIEPRGNEPWGGEAINCLGGPGRTSWDRRDEDGFPIWLTEYILEDGLKRTFDITNLIDVARGGIHSTPIANYMKDFDTPLEDLPKDLSNFPNFLAPGNLRFASPFYTFECRDSAGEILHQINLMIREWNTYEEFYAYYDSGGDDESANPDVTGEEGDDCEYEDRQLFGISSPCNDYCDLDDFLEEECPSCDGYPCARYD